ncbi:hypothetical protein MRX96_007143 [Rhipicephalus microplus]
MLHGRASAEARTKQRKTKPSRARVRESHAVVWAAIAFRSNPASERVGRLHLSLLGCCTVTASDRRQSKVGAQRCSPAFSSCPL